LANAARKSSARHSRSPGIFVLLILAILTWLADFSGGERERGGEGEGERERGKGRGSGREGEA